MPKKVTKLVHALLQNKLSLQVTITQVFEERKTFEAEQLRLSGSIRLEVMHELYDFVPFFLCHCHSNKPPVFSSAAAAVANGDSLEKDLGEGGAVAAGRLIDCLID